jgi:hypothetical protein
LGFDACLSRHRRRQRRHRPSPAWSPWKTQTIMSFRTSTITRRSGIVVLRARGSLRKDLDTLSARPSPPRRHAAVRLVTDSFPRALARWSPINRCNLEAQDRQGRRVALASVSADNYVPTIPAYLLRAAVRIRVDGRRRGVVKDEPELLDAVTRRSTKRSTVSRLA